MSEVSGDPGGRGFREIVRPGCTISAHQSGDRYVIAVRGELDHLNVDVVESVLAETAGAHEVMFELGDATFVDSAGLRIFIQALRQVQPIDGRVILSQPSTTLRRLLELTGLDQHFEIEP